LTQNLAAGNSIGYFANLYCFTMLNPPTGTQSFVATRANCYALSCATAYYSGVTSLGTPITNNSVGTATVSLAATSTSTTTLYANAFTFLPTAAGDAFTAYNQTQRSPTTLATSPDGGYDPLVFGDAIGNGATLTFSVHQSGTNGTAGGIILPLVP
ncbi:MAG TPA: hypothetical protein VGF36_02630, partial [Rhodopila sp.]